jgi:glycosyltransferase involved in cell wall biosynthesis
MTMTTSENEKSVLIAATHPLQCTGYARVGAALANGLAQRGWRVTYWGFQNLAAASGRWIDPRINVLDVGHVSGDAWGFGEAHLPQAIRESGADTVILYNDLMVVNRFLDHIHADLGASRPRLVAYIDVVHDDEDTALLASIVSRVDTVWVFAGHWKEHLAARFPHGLPPVHVVPHGMDPALLRVDATQAEARRAIGLPESLGFLVLNTNRNSYRKALDLSIDAFLLFWKTHPDSALLLNNNGAIESGYSIPDLVMASCRRLGIQDMDKVLREVVLGLPNGGFVDDRTLVLLHLASDVGLNTCLGEGFGLCQLEGACLGRPQIATQTGGLGDILRDQPPHVLIQPAIHLALPRGFVAHCGTLDIPDPRDVAEALETLYNNNKAAETAATLCVKFRERYDWDAIIDKAIDSLAVL